ncbi:MAG: hypothetical protein ABIF84_00440 [Patescibacteria group bacterium]
MRLNKETITLGGDIDRKIIRPAILTYAKRTAGTTAEAFQKFVSICRRRHLYVNFAVLTPLLLKEADEIILSDQYNIQVGQIKTPDDLPLLVSENLSLFNKPGLLRVSFPDQSQLSLPIPLLQTQVHPNEPNSIQY